MLHKGLSRSYVDKELHEKHGIPNMLVNLSMEEKSGFGNLTRMGILDFEFLAIVTGFKAYRICDSKCNDLHFLA
jgi:hypothetical protein